MRPPRSERADLFLSSSLSPSPPYLPLFLPFFLSFLFCHFGRVKEKGKTPRWIAVKREEERKSERVREDALKSKRGAHERCGKINELLWMRFTRVPCAARRGS